MKKLSIIFSVLFMLSNNAFAEEITFYDVNKDNKITATDASMVLQFLADPSSYANNSDIKKDQIRAMDVNNDYCVTPSDGANILIKALNKDIEAEKRTFDVIDTSTTWDFTTYDMKGQDFVELSEFNGLTIYNSLSETNKSGIYKNNPTTRKPFVQYLKTTGAGGISGISRKHPTTYSVLEFHTSKPGKLSIEAHNPASHFSLIDIYNNEAQLYVENNNVNENTTATVTIDVEPGQVFIVPWSNMYFIKIDFVTQQ